MIATDNPVQTDREILGGVPVFAGTRVPVRAMWDYPEAGDSLDLFLEHFPTASREMVIIILELASDFRRSG